MLIRHNIILVIRIDWLMLRRYIDIFCRKLDACKVFEQVRVVRGVEVDVRERGVAGL